MFEEERVFGVCERSVGGATVVEVAGELDILAAAALSVRLDELTAVGRPDVVLDLRGVTFIDCSGLSVLVRLRARTLAREGRLGIVTGSPQVLRLLRLTRLTRVFALHDDLASALAAPRAGRNHPGAASDAIA